MRAGPISATLMIIAFGAPNAGSAQATVAFEIPVNLSGVSPEIAKVGVTCLIMSSAFVLPPAMQSGWSNLTTNNMTNILADQLYPNASRQEFWISGSLNITARVVVAIPADWLENPVGKPASYGCAVLGWSRTTMKWGVLGEQATEVAYKVKMTPPVYQGDFVW